MPAKLGAFDITDAKFGGRGSLIRQHPFLIYLSSKENESENESKSSITIKIRPGTINGILPSNMFSSFSMSKTGIHVIKLQCQTNMRTITSAVIQVSDNQDIVNEVSDVGPPATAQVILGFVIDGEIFCVAYSNLVFLPRIVFVQPTPAAGNNVTAKLWWQWVSGENFGYYYYYGSYYY